MFRYTQWTIMLIGAAVFLAACAFGSSTALNNSDTPGATTQQSQAAPATSAPSASSQNNSGSSATTPASAKGCALLTSAEAVKILGEPIDQDNSDSGALPTDSSVWSYHCEYITKGYSVEIGAASSPNIATPFAADKAKAGSQPVQGLGDSAYVQGGQLNVLKGTVVLNIGVRKQDSNLTPMNDMELAVAKIALSRLP
jgi:hypothetical protein